MGGKEDGVVCVAAVAVAVAATPLRAGVVMRVRRARFLFFVWWRHCGHVHFGLFSRWSISCCSCESRIVWSS